MGRPPTGQRQQVAVRLAPEDVAWLDAETIRQRLQLAGGKPNRSEMIRRLILEARTQRSKDTP